MPAYTQKERHLVITSPLGTDVLLVERLDMVEALSKPFHIVLHLLVTPENAASVTFDKIVGQAVTIAVAQPGQTTPRYFNGVVAKFAEGDLVHSSSTGDSFFRFRAELVPKMLLTLAKKARSRTFQHKSVLDILKLVLTGFPVTYSVTATLQPRDYVVQYRESDYDFACRLMEDEGISYYFTHADGLHTLVLNDNPASFPATVPASIAYQEATSGEDEVPRVTSWSKSQDVRAGKVTLRDHCFEKTGETFEAIGTPAPTITAGTISHSTALGGNSAFELYDFPGWYAGRFDGINSGGSPQPAELTKISTDNTRTAKIRIEEEITDTVEITGSSVCRGFAAGAKFSLTNHRNANGSYILTRVEHTADQKDAFLGKRPGALVYSNRFSCAPAAAPIRPARLTPRPIALGLEHAVVVGSPGQDIFTDKYGRVKVQFLWDREGKKNADSSCWIRVATHWSGAQWGTIFTPRIGMEVAVAFLHGNPDEPLIVGTVYNNTNMPPYTLPDDKTQSGIKSRSTLQGQAIHFNELRFEDKKGSEQIYFHAEKDFLREVENNDTLVVGGPSFPSCVDGSQTDTIWKNRTTTIKTGDEKFTVEMGSQTDEIFKDRTTTIKTGNETFKVQLGSQTDTIFKDRSTTIQTGNDTIKVSLGASSTTALQKIELICGMSSVTLQPAQIELKCGPATITMTPAGITAKGIMIQATADAMVQIKGAIVQINGDGIVMVKGGIVLIN